MTELDKINPIPMFERNTIRLSKAQAKLYLYLKHCTDNGIKVDIDNILDIYWKEVKGGDEAIICRNCGGGLQDLRYKDAKEFFKNDYSCYKYFIIQPAKTWCSNNIGSLVMKGFITIVPNFDAKLIED
jgi:hypothetical protein